MAMKLICLALETKPTQLRKRPLDATSRMTSQRSDQHLTLIKHQLLPVSLKTSTMTRKAGMGKNGWKKMRRKKMTLIPRFDVKKSSEPVWQK
jgi:hypothetical protein